VRYASYGYPVTVRELASEEAAELPGGTRLRARTVPHTAASVAYSIERAGRRVVYTGDTGFDVALGEWAAGCDVLLCECSLPAAMAIPSHLTPEQCGALAALARPRLLALTHFYPPVERVDIRTIVAEQFDGPVVLATDGWSTDIEE
jgi:ribonuclease BN (tRNA processing enzyme)